MQLVFIQGQRNCQKNGCKIQHSYSGGQIATVKSMRRNAVNLIRKKYIHLTPSLVMKAHYTYMKNESFRIFQIHDLNKHDCHVFGFVSQRYNPAKFNYAPSVLVRSHRPFSPRTYVINWNQVFFNWFPGYSQMIGAEILKFI